MTSGQQVNGGNFGIFFDLLDNYGMLSVLIRISSMRHSNEYTQYTIPC